MTIYPFQTKRGCRSYLLVDEVSREAALIDPSEELGLEEYLATLQKYEAKLCYIIETHTHADHISSVPALRSATDAKVVRHTLAPSSLRDIAVTGGEVLALGSETLTILATPGHTNESITVQTDTAVFTGDALLIGGTGRTDFQLGDSEALYVSLHDTLGKLSDDTLVYPAHDYKGRESSTLGDEKRTNPRLALSREDFVAAMNAHHPPEPELFTEALEVNSR
jgi:glyoxylase-like metal-dependent hydrolase (beta-lactamase superfamily II)